MNIDQITQAIKLVQELNLNNKKDSTELALYKKYFELSQEAATNKTKITKERLLQKGFRLTSDKYLELKTKDFMLGFYILDDGSIYKTMTFTNMSFMEQRSFDIHTMESLEIGYRI